MSLVQYLSTPVGRFIRIVLGLNLIWIGAYVLGKPEGYILQMVALIPMLLGAFNICLIAPLFGAPMKGSELQHRHHPHPETA